VVADKVDGIKRLVGIAVALVAFLLPLVAFALALALIDGKASIAYYEAVAQIVPIVILALAIELRYFAPGREVPEALRPYLRRPELARALGFVYAAVTLLALVASEAMSLWAVAAESSDQFKLSLTTAGLTAGAVALVLAILLPAPNETGAG
jgi:hypothetical protein